MGRITLTRSGLGFVRPEDRSLADVVVAAGMTGGAMNDDRVVVKLEAVRRRDTGDEPSTRTGAVAEVLSRCRNRVVGTLHRRGTTFQVTPDDPRAPCAIDVGTIGDRAAVGKKVVVELEPCRAARSSAPALKGRLVEVLGTPGDPAVETLGVMRQYTLGDTFPDEVLAEARAIGSRVGPRDLAGRADCRQDLVVSVDPTDAEDLDDAFGLTHLREGGWRLWVHVADVSHYVRPGSAVDREAMRRGNSTYLPGRVIPMLPESLSNDICSLRPGVDRLTSCVELELTEEGDVLHTRVYRAVVRSRRRLTYDEAGLLLEVADVDAVGRMLHEANFLAQRVRRRRFQSGALPMDVPETKLRLDADGRVTRVDPEVHGASHQMIEELMLLANEAVATQLGHRVAGAVYRVHDAPEADRLQEYRDEVLRAGVPCGDLTLRSEVSTLLARLEGSSRGSALRIGLLKCLPRARYSTEPLGHYGLAKAHYTHFTSPIRRYADLVVHRCVLEDEGRPQSVPQSLVDQLSEAERNSASAERDSRLGKLLAFLAAGLRSGTRTVYRARVMDVRDFGLLVDVADLGIGGIIRTRSRGTVTRASARPSSQLGDEMLVQVREVELARRLVGFSRCGTESGRVAHSKTPSQTSSSPSRSRLR